MASSLPLFQVILLVGVLVLVCANIEPVQGTRDLNEGAMAKGEEVDMPQALCASNSRTYSGVCTSSKGCAYTCQTQEHASAGACHIHHLVNPRCYCYYHC